MEKMDERSYSDVESGSGYKTLEELDVLQRLSSTVLSSSFCYCGRLCGA